MQVVIQNRVCKYVCYADGRSSCGSHPEHIMVAPLDIHLVVFHECFHYDIRSGTTIKDVSNNVESVDDEAFNDITDSDDKVLRFANLDDSGNNIVVIFPFIVERKVSVQQLVDDIGVFRRQRFTNFGTGVFGRYDMADLNKIIQRPLIKCRLILNVWKQFFQFLFRVVDEGSQCSTFLLREFIREKHVNFLPDGTRGASHNMGEGLILTMDIRHEMFCRLGQVHNGIQVDDFRSHRLLRWILLPEQAEIIQLRLRKLLIYVFSHFQVSSYFVIVPIL